MRKISVWAKYHQWSARLIIIVSFIFLNVLGLSTGLLLHDLGINLSVSTIVFFTLLYAAGFIYYPFKIKKKSKRKNPSNYLRQKTCDILLAGSTYLMIVYFGNHKEMLFQYSLPFSQASASNNIFPKDSAAKTYKSIAVFNRNMKDENGNLLKWKERKHLLKEQVRAIKKDNDLSGVAKAALIVLAVIAALGLLYLVAALACNLSCGGSDVGAVLVTIGGTALVIFLLVIVIRSILGKQKRKKESGIPKNAFIPETAFKSIETS